MAGVLVLGELLDGRPQPITSELIAAGRLLGDKLDEEVSVVFLGSEIQRVSCESIAGIADTVYFVEDPLLASSQIDLQLSALEQMCIQAEPSVVLVGKTSLGIDIGPRLAFRMGVGIAHDCIGIDVDSGTGRLVVIRPVYGGDVVAKVTFTGTSFPQIAIIRQKVYTLPAKSVHGCEFVRVRVILDPSMAKSRVIGTIRQNQEDVCMEDADIVVAGGRGLGGPVPFDLLREVARLLDGALAASGAACSAGWIDHGYKVGLTGKTIAPKLYIAVGISGASHHMAGCSNAKHVVAINRDANANIFKVADFGVVGDWAKILPSFMESVREISN